MVEELDNDTQQDIVNPGELLRRERERVGFSAEEVATHLHLSKTTLGYLEAGRFDRLPGDTFTRGYIRSYARLLKLDPNTLARHYDRYVGADTRETRVTPINRVSVAPRRITRWIMTLSTLIIIASMLALGLWWWSDSRDATPMIDDSDVSALIDDVQVDAMALPESFASGESVEVEELVADTAKAVADDDVVQDSAVPEPDTAPQPEIAEPQAASPAAAPAVEETAQPVPAPAAAPGASSGNGLVMVFSDNCWVQVSVPGGRVLHSGQMRQGQTLNIDQQGPLDLVIGAANAVSTIEYNGQPVELSANRQSGVARLRLGQ